MPQYCPHWAPRVPAYPESITNTLITTYHIIPYAPTHSYMTIHHMEGSLLDIIFSLGTHLPTMHG
jgi:hypothetical protein